MTTVDRVLSEARKWIGTKQGTAKHKSLVDAYNSISPKPRGYTLKMTDDWCDAFVTVVFDKAGASKLIGREVGVQRHIDIFKSKGIWIEDGKIKPKVGDIITYNWDDGTQPNTGWADHIGIVEKVGTKYITVIEGNISYRVDRRRIEIGHGNIRGYARPKYAGGSQPAVPAQPEKKPAKKSINEIAQEVIDGKWGNGSERKSKLESAGYNYTTVQNKVNALLGVSGGATQQSKTAKPVKKSGRWQFSTNVNIRSKPSINSEKVGLYRAGQTVDISNTIQKGGYIWGEYKAYSGNIRYVALGIIGGIQYGKWI